MVDKRAKIQKEIDSLEKNLVVLDERERVNKRDKDRIVEEMNRCGLHADSSLQEAEDKCLVRKNDLLNEIEIKVNRVKDDILHIQEETDSKEG